MYDNEGMVHVSLVRKISNYSENDQQHFDLIYFSTNRLQ